MAEATGEIVETPTEELPYKAVIKAGGEIVREQFFCFAREGRNLYR